MSPPPVAPEPPFDFAADLRGHASDSRRLTLVLVAVILGGLAFVGVAWLFFDRTAPRSEPTARPVRLWVPPAGPGERTFAKLEVGDEP